MPIKIIRTDITKIKCDAIVNAANKTLLGGGGVDGAIHKAAGAELLEECKTLGGCSTGEAKITSAYNLPCKYVIHTVGPAIPQGMKPSGDDCEKLESCYRSCLEIADEYNLESIAFCGISTGVFNFPKDLAAEIAVETVRQYLDTTETSLNHVIFNVFSDDNYSIYKKILFGG